MLVPCAASKHRMKGAKELKTPIYITPSRASHSAIKVVESLGGSVICRHYNALALRDCIQGRTDRLAAAPTRREDISGFSLRFDLTLIFIPLQCGTRTSRTVDTFPKNS
jgi:hypothetical protein